jgi:hypothetical protein
LTSKMESTPISNAAIANPAAAPVAAQANGTTTIAGAAVANTPVAQANPEQTRTFAQVIEGVLAHAAVANAQAPVLPTKTATSASTKSCNAGAPSSVQSTTNQDSSALPLSSLVASLSAATVSIVPIPADSLRQAVPSTEQIAPNNLVNTSGEASGKSAEIVRSALQSSPLACNVLNAGDALLQAQTSSGKQTWPPQAVSLDANLTAADTATIAQKDGLPAAAPGCNVSGSAGATPNTKENQITPQLSVNLVNEINGEPLSSVLKQLQELQTAGTQSEVSVSSTAASAAQTTMQQPAAAATALPVVGNVIPTDPKTAAGSQFAAISKAAMQSGEATKEAAALPAIASSTENHADGHNNSSAGNGQSSANPNNSKDAPAALPSAPSFGPALATVTAKAEGPVPTPSSTATVFTAAPSAEERIAPPPTTATATPLPNTVSNPSVTNGDPTAIHIANDAQLMQTATHSEMRIAMQTDKLGAIELHARLSGDEVGAVIVVEKRDAHAALALELPALQQALSEKQLRVDQVTLTHSMLSSTAGDAGASSQQGHRGATPRSALPSFQTTAESPATGSFLAQEQLGVFNSQGRLSVLA